MMPPIPPGSQHSFTKHTAPPADTGGCPVDHGKQSAFKQTCSF